MKVTDNMLRKWARAGFLLIIGVVFLIYLPSVLVELQTGFENFTESDAERMFTFVEALLYIFTFWLFVSAALNIVSGFKEPKGTIDDLARKIDALDEKLTKGRESESVDSEKTSETGVIPTSDTLRSYREPSREIPPHISEQANEIPPPPEKL